MTVETSRLPRMEPVMAGPVVVAPAEEEVSSSVAAARVEPVFVRTAVAPEPVEGVPVPVTPVVEAVIPIVVAPVVGVTPLVVAAPTVVVAVVVTAVQAVVVVAVPAFVCLGPWGGE